jgi:hypothetical protein
MIPIDLLQQDHATLSQILAARQAVTAVTLPAGMRILWTVYLAILEDALATLTALINYLTPRS